MGALEFLALQAFLVSLALMPEPLPVQLQQELNTAIQKSSIDVELLLQIAEVHPPLYSLFRDVRLVEGLRSHQYQVLHDQQITATGSLPSKEDWLRLLISCTSTYVSNEKCSQLKV